MTPPLLDDAADWPALHAQPLSIWRPAFEELGSVWGLGGGWERLPGGEDSVVFAQGGTVVKLVPPFLAEDAVRDVSVLRRLDLPVPTPRVEDVRNLEGWTAVRMARLGGWPADRVWARLERADRLRLLTAVGALLQAIWRTPLEAADGNPVALLTMLRVRARRHVEDGFRDPLDFVDRHLPDPLPAPALLHLDLNDGNLMLEERGGRWELSGVLDFVAARACYPPLDLVTPNVFFCRGDPALLGALLAGAGVSGLDPAELSAWHLLHPFSRLPRDLALAGRARTALEDDLLALWNLHEAPPRPS
jgi:aminoglycoside phosphotransferase (APT) family kinase protein